MIDYPIDYFFGLGARYQHVGRHRDAAAAELRATYDMLYGAVALEVFEGPMEAQQVALVDGLLL